MMITRFLESLIVKALQHFPAVAILGPRQVGKTTLAKMITERLNYESFYIDLENPEDQAIISEPFRFFKANEDKLIIIDEIQRNKELFPLLRSAIDLNRKPGRFILLGSASPELLFLSNETLAGRIVYKELTPFKFNEINSIKSIQDHWLFGGYPQPFLTDDEFFRQEWFRSFHLTYIERDFRTLGLAALPAALSRFFSMLAHIHGNLLNKSMLANSLGINQTTISNYLNYFREAFLIRELPSWHPNIGKRIIKSPKIYIRDSGLLNFLHRIKNINDMLGHPVIGHSWEGYVIEQIISYFGDSYEYYFYRTQDGTEADLVLVRSNKPVITIEIKYTSAPKLSKGLSTAIKDLGTLNNFIIIPEVRQTYSLHDNLAVTDLSGFIDKINQS